VSRRPAAITQADLARAIRAAKQAGAAEVEVRIGEQSSTVIRLNSSTGAERLLEPVGEIVL
jgi:class 3 adenylate cyclase